MLPVIVNRRLPAQAYRTHGSVWLVTAVTYGRRPVLTRPDTAHSVVDSLTFKCTQTGSDLLLWCLMPDHVHALLTIGNGDLMRMMAEIKSFTGRRYHQQTGKTLWQESFHDRGIRPDEPLDEVAAYVCQNPVRRGLVATWEEWPWTGGLLIASGEVSDRAGR